jgi:hypothetical protein
MVTVSNSMKTDNEKLETSVFVRLLMKYYSKK